MTLDSNFSSLVAATEEAPPGIALVLGSGLGPLAARVRPEASVPFSAIPGLPPTGIAGHKGCLTLGHWAGTRVLVFEGRIHYYEGHPWEAVDLLVQTAYQLGARRLLLTNAAGGIREDLGPGSLMILRNHVEWTRPFAWRHPGEPLGPARPSPYDAALIGRMHEAARAEGLDLREGVYAMLTGPCYETPAEIRALRAWGADAVGMSTAREALAAAQLGMEVVALSSITNKAAGLGDGPLDHTEVLTNACAVGERLAGLLERFLTRFGEKS